MVVDLSTSSPPQAPLANYYLQLSFLGIAVSTALDVGPVATPGLGGEIAKKENTFYMNSGIHHLVYMYTPIKITGKKPINIIFSCFHYYG